MSDMLRDLAQRAVRSEEFLYVTPEEYRFIKEIDSLTWSGAVVEAGLPVSRWGEKLAVVVR